MTEEVVLPDNAHFWTLYDARVWLTNQGEDYFLDPITNFSYNKFNGVLTAKQTAVEQMIRGTLTLVCDNAREKILLEEKVPRSIGYYTTVQASGKSDIIEPKAFINAMYLQFIHLDDIREIGENAFYGCKELKQVFAPDLKKIGKGAFMKTNCEIILDDAYAEGPKRTIVIDLDFDHTIEHTFRNWKIELK